MTWLLTLMMSVSLVQADNGCEVKLSSEPKASFDHVIKQLHDLNLASLTESLDLREVAVSFRPRRFPWQRDVDYRNTIVQGRRILIVRDLKWDDEPGRQRAIWKVAEALYALELDKKLWSYRTMLPERTEGLASWARMPKAYRDARLSRLNEIQADLYRLLDALPEVRAVDVLPERDPGRLWTLWSAIGLDASKRIAPNLKDNETRAVGGLPAVAAANSERHSRSIVLNYYLDWLRRMTIVGAVAAGVMFTPYLEEIPSYVEAHMSWVASKQERDQAPAQIERLQQQAYVRKLDRLIKEEDAKLYPDLKKIERMKAEYKELVEKSPWLALPDRKLE